MHAIVSQLRTDLAALVAMFLSACAHPLAFLTDLMGWS